MEEAVGFEPTSRCRWGGLPRVRALLKITVFVQSAKKSRTFAEAIEVQRFSYILRINLLTLQ
jgi:hypothetical protein